MKRRIITVLLAGMMVIGLVGCGANTASAENATTEVVEQEAETVEETKTVEVVETQPVEMAEAQVEEPVQEDAVKVEEAEVTTVVEDEEVVEEINSEMLMDQLSDMLINYKDKVDKTQSSYDSLPSQFRFADLNDDEYPELFLLKDDGVITVLTYYNGDAWDAFDAAMGGEWMGSCNTCGFNINGGKIRTFKNVGNRYEDNYVYEYVMGEYGPSLKPVKFATTLNDVYTVGVDFSHKQEVSRTEYEKFLDGMNEEYDVTLTGDVNDGYFTIDDAYEAYLTEKGLN